MDALSINPSAWNGYHEAADLIGHLSILSGVQDDPQDPHIKYVRCIAYPGQSSAQVLEDAELRNFPVLTVVKPESSPWWLVRGLSDSCFPARDEVGEL